MLLYLRKPKCCILIGFYLLTSAGCGRTSTPPNATTAPSKPSFVITVIPKGEQHVFWGAVRRGAESIRKEYDDSEGLEVFVEWSPPTMDDNARFQMEQVRLAAHDLRKKQQEGMLTAIVLAPLDEELLLEPVIAAKDEGVPVVIMDSGLEGKAGTDFVSFVATDNFQAGQKAGELVVDSLKEKNEEFNDVPAVWILNYRPGSGSTSKRCVGLRGRVEQEEIGGDYRPAANFFGPFDYPNYQTVLKEIFNGSMWAATPEHAKVTAKAMLMQMHADASRKSVSSTLNKTKFDERWTEFVERAKRGSQDSSANAADTAKDSSTDQDESDKLSKLFFESLRAKEFAIFCPNESTTIGMHSALVECGLAKEVLFVGFDVSDGLYKAIKEGQITGLIIQRAEEIGRLAARAAVEYLRNDDKNAGTYNYNKRPSFTLTKETCDDEEAIKLLKTYRIKLGDKKNGSGSKGQSSNS